MHWAADYLGKPWRIGANGPTHYDCWGLVRAVYADRLQIALPAAGLEFDDMAKQLEVFRDHPERGRWSQVARPTEYDAVLMAHGRYPVHVGVWIEAGPSQRVLHACRPAVIAQDTVALKAHGYRVCGVYRLNGLST